MKWRILATSGKQGSGKTSATNELIRRLSETYNIKSFKFAGVIYEMHDTLLPICKKYGIRPESMNKDGDLLQILGTEYGRNKIGEDVWVNVVNRLIVEHLKDRNAIALLDDCRFENEFDAFNETAFKVRLNCPREVRKARILEGGGFWRETDNHPSEVGLDNYDEQGKFDLYINTEITPIKETVDMILDTWANGNR